MRYVIVGAGGVGGTIGARLVQAGRDVVFVARGPHHDALRDKGLTFLTPDEHLELPVTVVAEPQAVDWQADDVAVVATKTQDSLAVYEAIAIAAPASIHVVCAQNGVENERIALRRFANVHAMCVMLPGTHLEPGVIEANGTPNSGILDLGRYPAGVDEIDEAIAADLSDARFVSEPDPRVMRQKYAKLLMNLGNALEAIVGEGARASELFERARAEGIACFEAAGIEFASLEEDLARRGDHFRMKPVQGRRRGGGSSWQSMARGTGSIETDYLNGEIVSLGRQFGVPTPVNELLQRTANRLAARRAPAGSLTAEELLSQLG